MKIIIAGDFVPIGRFEKCLKDNSFDYRNIKSITDRVDFSILNFEAPIVGNDIKGIKKDGPCLKVDNTSVNAIKEMGFDAVTLANNHFRDYGQDGVDTTLAVLNTADIEHVGGGKNIDEAQKPLIKEFEDGTVAFVNFCENEFSIATDCCGGAMPMDISRNYYQLKKAKELADYVVVIVHGGYEGYQLPGPRMKAMYRLYIDIGADAVINHHQHCFSGYEIYQGKPIFYGLGNFIFDRAGMFHNKWNYGYLVKLNFSKTKIEYELIPYEQCNERPGAYLLHEEKQIAFNEEVSQLNEIIADDESLNNAFYAFSNEKKRGVLATLGPFANRYLIALINRGFLPTFISKKKAVYLYSYINCEAHRDITLQSLREVIEDK